MVNFGPGGGLGQPKGGHAKKHSSSGRLDQAGQVGLTTGQNWGGDAKNGVFCRPLLVDKGQLVRPTSIGQLPSSNWRRAPGNQSNFSPFPFCTKNGSQKKKDPAALNLSGISRPPRRGFYLGEITVFFLVAYIFLVGNFNLWAILSRLGPFSSLGLGVLG